MPSNSEKNEKSLAEFVVIVVLVGILMSVFINYYLKQGPQFTNAGFTSLAQNFTTKVATIHAQWLMDKQPNYVSLASINNTNEQLIPVNQWGWVDVKETSLVCEQIWQLVMEAPLTLMKLPIAAIEVRDFANQSKNDPKLSCRYVLPNGNYFDYNRVNGRVSTVVTQNSED